MAEIVFGIGSSHGPLLSTPPEQWDLRAKADRANTGHWFRGKTYDFEGLLAARAPGLAMLRLLRRPQQRGIRMPRASRHARRRQRAPFPRPTTRFCAFSSAATSASDVTSGNASSRNPSFNRWLR